MKKLLIIIAMLAAGTAYGQQRVTKDANGNYVQARRSDTTANKATGHTIKASDGKTYPVYISARGLLFYNRVSKKGNTYKVYIKEQ